MEIEDKKWIIYIDIEGFSELYPDGTKGIIPLVELIRAIYRIGNNFYHDFDKLPSRNRLLAYQTGDGFFICSDIEEKLNRPVLISIFLLKYLTKFNAFGKAIISKGNLSSIVGCYPEEVRNKNYDSNIIEMGRGLMFLWGVMGINIINAVKLQKESPPGPLLILESKNEKRLSEKFIIKKIKNTCPQKDIEKEMISINWIHFDNPLLHDISKKTGLKLPPSHKIEETLKEYINNHNLSDKSWGKNCKKYLFLK